MKEVAVRPNLKAVSVDCGAVMCPNPCADGSKSRLSHTQSKVILLPFRVSKGQERTWW